MIEIKQGTNKTDGLNTLLEKMECVDIPMNVDLIQYDINRLTRMSESSENSNDKANISIIIAYLKKLMSKVENGVYQISWRFESYKISAYPLDLNHYAMYNVHTSDYIETDKKIVRFDYTDVYQLIAFEMMHRDIGYETSEIEEHLKNVGITSINDVEIMQDYIAEDALKWSEALKIGDSPYATKDGMFSYDYFYTDENKPFRSRKYKDCVSRSVDMALAIITNALIKKFISSKVYFKLCSVTKDGIYFILDNTDNIEEYAESVAVRVFGRVFEVKPNIEVF